MLRFAPIFTDHLVLQRGKPLRIWGTAEEGTLVTVSIGSVTAAAETIDGRWTAVLPALPTGGPYTLTAADGTDTLSITDVMLGEVWLCGGQSNMELALKDSADPAPALAACKESNVRLYHVGKRGYFDETFYAEEAASHWQLPCADACRHWTAVGFYFAAELAQKLGVTVGLVECCYGGTSVSAWMSGEMLERTAAGRLYLDDYTGGMAGLTEDEANAAYAAYLEYHMAWQERYAACLQEHPGISWEDATEFCGESGYPGPWAPVNPLRPHGLFDTMLTRITPFTLRGVLYYQGESDDHRPEHYELLLTCMIREWRGLFRDAALPFLLVQLPMYGTPVTAQNANWAQIRLAQDRVCRTVRNTGLAVIPDCGEWNEIHPKEKRTPAHRLFLLAEREVYRHLTENAAAPILRTAVPGNGGILLHFDNVDNGLELRGSEGFELCGADGIWHPAAAEPNEDTVFLSSPAVPYPVHARYLWYNYGPVTLFEQNGLPTAPFHSAYL